MPTTPAKIIDAVRKAPGTRVKVAVADIVNYHRHRLPLPRQEIERKLTYACPACQTPLGEPVDDLLVCANPACGRRCKSLRPESAAFPRLPA